MSYPEIDSTGAQARLDEFRVIDVRQAHEFSGPLGHIDGAELVPLGNLPGRAGDLIGERPLLLVCRSGARSGEACEILLKKGAQVCNLAGGMIAWNRAGLPVERPRARSLEAVAMTVVDWLTQIGPKHLDDFRADIAAFLQDSGASDGRPSAGDTSRALDDIERKLTKQGATAPPDLDLSMVAFRSDLAAI